MEDYKRYHIPAFGNWELSEGLPISQYFEDARQDDLFRYTDYGVDDLYKNEFFMVTTPTLLSYPKVKESSKRYQTVTEAKKKQCKVCDVTEPPRLPKAPKAVDEDLYKIPPDLLRGNRKKSKVMGFFTCCLEPSCAA